MKLTPNFYRDRVCLNVLAGSKDNASEIYEAAEGHVLVGVLSKNYPDIASAVADMREYAKRIDNALSSGWARATQTSRRWSVKSPVRCSRSTLTRSSPAWRPAARC